MPGFAIFAAKHSACLAPRFLLGARRPSQHCWTTGCFIFAKQPPLRTQSAKQALRTRHSISEYQNAARYRALCSPALWRVYDMYPCLTELPEGVLVRVLRAAYYSIDANTLLSCPGRVDDYQDGYQNFHILSTRIAMNSSERTAAKQRFYKYGRQGQPAQICSTLLLLHTQSPR
jgi:hypothetical protein